MAVRITGGQFNVNLTTKGGFNRATISFSGGPLKSAKPIGSYNGPQIFGTVEIRNNQNVRSKDTEDGYVNITVGWSNPSAFVYGATSGTSDIAPGVYSRNYELVGRDNTVIVQQITLNVSEDPNWPYAVYVAPDDGGFTTGAKSPAPSPSPSPVENVGESVSAPSPPAVDMSGVSQGSANISAAGTALAAAMAATSNAFSRFGNGFVIATDENTAAIRDQTERFKVAYENLRKELTRLLETKNGITTAEGIVGLGALYTYFQNLGWSGIEVISKYEDTIPKNEALLNVEPIHENLNPAQDHVEERFIDATDHLDNDEEY